MKNQPLRHPSAPSATPTEGMLYVTAAGVWRQFTQGAWQDVKAGTATKLTSRAITLTGAATGSVSTDWASNPSIPVTVNRNAHTKENVAMVALQTTDNANSIPQNSWTRLGFNTNHCNDNGMWDGGGTVYLNTVGYYLIVGHVRWYWDTDAGRRLSELRVNSGWKWSKGFGATSTGEHGRTMQVVAYSGGGQTVELWCYNESSGSNRPVFEAALAVWKIAT